MDSEHARTITSIEKNISYLQRRITDTEESITWLNQEIETWTELMKDSSVREGTRRIEKTESSISLLQSSNADNISQSDADRFGLRPFSPSQYERAKVQLADAKEQNDERSLGYITAALQRMESEFDEARRSRIENYSSDLEL